jgi:hypothetical protein
VFDDESQDSQEMNFNWHSPPSSQASLAIDISPPHTPVLTERPAVVEALSTSANALLADLFLSRKRKLSTLTAIANSKSETDSNPPSAASSPSTVPTPVSNTTPVINLAAMDDITPTLTKEKPRKIVSPSSPPRRLPGWMKTEHSSPEPITTAKVSSKPPSRKKTKSASFDDLEPAKHTKKSAFPIRLVIQEVEDAKVALYINTFDKRNGAKYVTCSPALPDGESDWSAGGIERTVTFHANIYSAISKVVDSVGVSEARSWNNKHAPRGIFTGDVSLLVSGYIQRRSTLKDMLDVMYAQK